MYRNFQHNQKKVWHLALIDKDVDMMLGALGDKDVDMMFGHNRLVGILLQGQLSCVS